MKRAGIPKDVHQRFADALLEMRAKTRAIQVELGSRARVSTPEYGAIEALERQLCNVQALLDDASYTEHGHDRPDYWRGLR